jgi:quercetin dioxygenase-like cupin family protein
MVAGDVAVIPGNAEHEGIFPEDTEVIDIFASHAKIPSPTE